MSQDNPMPDFTRIEFIEFSTAEEFRKFKTMPIITKEEIEQTHIGDLIKRLQSEKKECK